jgi:Ca2+-binding RTX toxin-like protein
MPPAPGTLANLKDEMLSNSWGNATSPWTHWQNQSKVVYYYIYDLDTQAEQDMAEMAMQLWADIVGITPVKVGLGGVTALMEQSLYVIHFDDVEDGEPPGTEASGNPIVINIPASWHDQSGTGVGSDQFNAFVHETGHALGLAHPGPYNDDGIGEKPEYANDALWDIDTRQASIMSYFEQSHYMGNSDALPMTPQMADILALQSVLGTNLDTRTYDTIYGFNSNAGAVFDFSSYITGAPWLPVALTIYDSDGIDTLDCSGFFLNQKIYLEAGAYSDIGGLHGNVGIWGIGDANDTIIENATGGSGDDYIYGNKADNKLHGGAGIDFLFGYGIGSPYGNDGEDDLYGEGGDDHLNGGDGHDVLFGGDDKDALWGDGGDDWLYGESGDDILIGGEGSDLLFPGDGVNTVGYSSSPEAVAVNLEQWTAIGGDAAGDIFGGYFQNAIGSFYDDVLIGDANDNMLWGGDGADELHGGDGNDLLFGEEGADTLFAGKGSDILDGGDGFDTAVYKDNAIAVIVDLADSTKNDGEAKHDTLIKIEKVIADNKTDDVLSGDDAENWLVGTGGNDLLNGRGGSDLLDGGEGNNTVTYVDADAPQGVTANLAAHSGGPTGQGDKEHDTFISIQNLIGSKYHDVLTGDDYANILDGGEDQDTLSGFGNSDILLGGGGDDVLDGGNDADTLDGGLGGDTLKGGSGSDTASYAHATAGVVANLSNPSENAGEALKDTYQSIENITGSAHDDKLTGNGASNKLDGGDGIDTAFYVDSFAGVVVNLVTGAGTGGTAAGDTLVSIENLVGSSHGDTLTGDSHPNVLDGGVGKDFLAGGAESDILLGGDGNDTLEGGEGADTLNGGSHNNTASYASSTRGVTVNLATGTATGGDAEGDTLTSIQNLIGSNQSNQKDQLTGDAGDNKLYGLDGNDTLNGGSGMDTLEGGANNDKLLGGADSDTFIFDVGFGIDVIKGFDDTKSSTDQDVICFHQSVFADFAAVKNAMSEVGSSVFITVDSQNHIELFETSLKQLGADDFLFI